MSSAVGLKFCASNVGIKKYNSNTNKKKKKKHDKMELLAKIKLNTINVLISKALIDSPINHDDFMSVKNVLRKYNEMKEQIKSQWKHTESVPKQTQCQKILMS